MIPKTIHYCWFGRGPLPRLAFECIESWRKFLPDHEIKLWNEDNFDINICHYTSQAYKAGKYAFVSDYARFWILYNHGGIYFDTDVKLLAPIKDILQLGAFMGTETNGTETGHAWARVNPGIGMAAEQGMPMLRELIGRYNTYRFIDCNNVLNLKTIVEYTTEYLKAHGFPNELTEMIHCCGFNIYPKEYFSPRSIDSRNTTITPETRSIHLFTNTWGQQKTFGKLISHIKLLLLNHILPTSYIVRRLQYNKALRDKYFDEHYIIHDDND